MVPISCKRGEESTLRPSIMCKMRHARRSRKGIRVRVERERERDASRGREFLTSKKKGGKRREKMLRGVVGFYKGEEMVKSERTHELLAWRLRIAMWIARTVSCRCSPL